MSVPAGNLACAENVAGTFAVSKYALPLMRAMAADHGPEGVRVNAICPDYIDTPMIGAFFQGVGTEGANRTEVERRQAAHDVHPLRTIGRPEDLANWLASDDARYANGQLWVLDGGLSAQIQRIQL